MSAPAQIVPAVPGGVLWGVLGIALVVAAFASGYWTATRNKLEGGVSELDVEGGHGFEVTGYGAGESTGLLSLWLRERKKSRALKNGYVRWHLVGSSFAKPRYVKPEREDGGNIPTLDHDGHTYEFPEEAAVPSQEEGVPTFVHREGDSDPVNLRDSWELAVDAKTLKEYLELTVTSENPNESGLIPSDWDTWTLFRYGVLGLVALVVLMEFLGNGIA